MDLALPSPVTFSSLFVGGDVAGRCWRRALTVSVALHGVVFGALVQHHLQSARLPEMPLQVVLSRPAAQPVAAAREEPPPSLPAAQPNRAPELIQASEASPVAPRMAERPVVEESAAVVPVIERAAVPPPAPALVVAPKAPDAMVLAGFNRILSQAVDRQKRYPRVALMRHWEGTAVLKLNIGSDGRLRNYLLATSSGHDSLDQQALEMLRDPLPLPELPVELAGLDLSIDIPVTFRIAD